MGLDMYLYKKVKGKKKEVAYWRKANMIHSYFMRNCEVIENDFVAKVTYNDLMNLRNTIKEVLKDKSLAPQKLPVRVGFFFGSYEYDSYYYQELEDTLYMINSMQLNENDKFIYYASW